MWAQLANSIHFCAERWWCCVHTCGGPQWLLSLGQECCKPLPGPQTAPSVEGVLQAQLSKAEPWEGACQIPWLLGQIHPLTWSLKIFFLMEVKFA